MLLTAKKERPMIYHQVPDNMVGSELYPLNVLKDTHAEVYREAIKKYENRKEVLEHLIPPLNCIWNDVLFLTGVHPSTLRKAFEKVNFRLRKLPFYEIDPELLENGETTVYLYAGKSKWDEEFVAFDPEDIQKHNAIGDETIQYYREQYAVKKSHLAYIIRLPISCIKGQLISLIVI